MCTLGWKVPCTGHPERGKIYGMSAEQKDDDAAAGEAQGPSFEDNLKKLESVVSQLEEGNLPLDKALELYEEGVKAYKACHEALEVAEARVAELVETLQGELKEEPFDTGGDSGP